MILQKALSVEAMDKLRYRLEKEEGYRKFPYEDSKSILTVGIGRNLKARGISHDEAIYMLNNDLKDVQAELWDKVAVYHDLDEVRQCVLIDMAFNLGVNGLLLFKKFLECLAAQDWKDASNAMMASLWARQVGNRAKELAFIIETGVL